MDSSHFQLLQLLSAFQDMFQIIEEKYVKNPNWKVADLKMDNSRIATIITILKWHASIITTAHIPQQAESQPKIPPIKQTQPPPPQTPIKRTQQPPPTQQPKLPPQSPQPPESHTTIPPPT